MNGISNQALDPCEPGKISTCIPCQSPSHSDMQVAIGHAERFTSGAVSADNLKGEMDAKRAEEGRRKLKEIEDFETAIGNVVASSGLRDIPRDETNNSHELMLIDWAIVHESPAFYQLYCSIPRQSGTIPSSSFFGNLTIRSLRGLGPFLHPQRYSSRKAALPESQRDE